MRSEDRVITELAESNPVPRDARPAAHDRAEADRVLEQVLSAPSRPRRSWPVLAPVAGAVVVIVVVAVALSLHSSPTQSGVPRGGGLRIVLQAQTTPQQPVTRAALSRDAEIVRERLRSVLHGFSVTPRAHELVITAGKVTPAKRARIAALASAPGELHIYDWEANALTPNGKTVAGELAAQDPSALTISQGASGAAPGQSGAGGLTLYEAVKLAAKQPRSLSDHNGRLGPQYYLFGAPGSAACAAEARTQGTLPIAGQHCLLAGPDNERYSTPTRQALRNLGDRLPLGVSTSDGQVMVVQQGTTVLEAANPGAGSQTGFSGHQAQFFVLRDNVALRNRDITNPHAASDASGAPDVVFGFDPAGRTRFQEMTGQVARRGERASTSGQSLEQHFAIALDNRLLTVPSIDYTVYPDGISGRDGADISASFTRQSAKDVAAELHYGALRWRCG